MFRAFYKGFNASCLRLVKYSQLVYNDFKKDNRMEQLHSQSILVWKLTLQLKSYDRAVVFFLKGIDQVFINIVKLENQPSPILYELSSGELEHLPLALIWAAEKPFKGLLRQQAQP